jgi:hypothetical protein
MATDDAEASVSGRRGRKELRRRKLKKARRKLVFAPPEERRPYRSPILNLFFDDDGGSRKRLPVEEFTAPVIFSISRNPGECLEYFQDIVTYARTARRPRIVLNQRKIRYLGLGADSILGVILSEIKSELRFTYGAYIKGFKPRSKEIQQLMDEVGSVRALFMESEQDIRLSFTSKAMVFRHRHRSADEGAESTHHDPSGLAISEFSDHLNDSLSIIGRELSIDGRDSFCHYAAEVIDNVREHAGLREWAIVGYSDPEAGVPTYRAVIFCFGKTIAQTFLDLPEDAYPRRVIAPYINAHKGGALFTQDWREEDLITLIALQGDISSKSVDSASDRGQGTVELIEFFQRITTECGIRNSSAEMNIISGSTRVRFDGTYQMSFRTDMNRDVIAFNPTNDLAVRPDRQAVMPLVGGRFPGTLITVEIPLTTSFLDAKGTSDED